MSRRFALDGSPRGAAVDIFQFFWGTLAWTATVAMLFPLNIPMAALAFRIWRETKDTDVEGSELWIRSALASVGVAVVCAAFLALDFVLADLAEFPAGPIHIIAFVGFFALACWVMAYMFSFEDYFQGVSLTILYLFLPLIALFLLNGLLGLLNPALRFWDPLVNVAKYCLKDPTP
jgi:hypothetical protein